MQALFYSYFGAYGITAVGASISILSIAVANAVACSFEKYSIYTYTFKAYTDLI